MDVKVENGKLVIHIASLLESMTTATSSQRRRSVGRSRSTCR